MFLSLLCNLVENWKSHEGKSPHPHTKHVEFTVIKIPEQMGHKAQLKKRGDETR